MKRQFLSTIITSKQMIENKGNETLNTNETLIDQIETLKFRIKNIECHLHKTMSMTSNTDTHHMDCTSEGTDSTSDITDLDSNHYHSSFVKSDNLQKKVRYQSTQSKIYEPRYFNVDEIPKVPASSIGKRMSNIFYDEEEDDEEDRYLSFKVPHSGGEKYILMHNEPEDLKKHIERLLTRVNKIELISQILLENAPNVVICPKSKKDSSEYNVDSDESDADNDYINAYVNTDISFNTKLNKLSRGEISKFQREYGILQKKKVLKDTITIGKFRKFFGDYTEKFEIISDLLSLHDKAITKNQFDITELLKNKVNYEEYNRFKENVKSTYNLLKDDIEYHVMRDPEAAGIVNYVKGVTCVSCAKPVMIKTQHVPLKNPSKNVYIPKSSTKAYLNYKLDRIRTHYNEKPKDKDLNILQNICKTIIPLQKCISNRPGCQKQSHTIILNKNIPTIEKRH